jgi:hypothetical protein
MHAHLNKIKQKHSPPKKDKGDTGMQLRHQNITYGGEGRTIADHILAKKILSRGNYHPKTRPATTATAAPKVIGPLAMLAFAAPGWLLVAEADVEVAEPPVLLEPPLVLAVLEGIGVGETDGG